MAYANDFEEDMYDTPIHIYTLQVKLDEQVKDSIVQVAQKYSISVDEEKLLQILRDDRKRYHDAYQRGYEAGKEAGENSMFSKMREFVAKYEED